MRKHCFQHAVMWLLCHIQRIMSAEGSKRPTSTETVSQAQAQAQALRISQRLKEFARRCALAIKLPDWYGLRQCMLCASDVVLPLHSTKSIFIDLFVLT